MIHSPKFDQYPISKLTLLVEIPTMLCLECPLLIDYSHD
jgi:hypothetical protein